jgi:hypothetical protein
MEGMVQLQAKIRHQEIFRKREKFSPEDLKAIDERNLEVEKQFQEFQKVQEELKH